LPGVWFTVVDVVVELTNVDVVLDGGNVTLTLEQPVAKTASPIAMTCLAFIDPPRSPT
jgi:hypothetical protein